LAPELRSARLALEVGAVERRVEEGTDRDARAEQLRDGQRPAGVDEDLVNRRLAEVDQSLLDALEVRQCRIDLVLELRERVEEEVLADRDELLLLTRRRAGDQAIEHADGRRGRGTDSGQLVDRTAAPGRVPDAIDQ